MKALVILIVTASIVTGSCQDRSDGATSDDEIYLSTPSPYKIVHFENTWSLPDSLAHGVNGNAVVDLFLDKDGKINGMNLKLLKIDSSRHYAYSPRPKAMKDYPNWVANFLPFVAEKVNELGIERNETVNLDPKAKYLVTLPVKLK